MTRWTIARFLALLLPHGALGGCSDLALIGDQAREASAGSDAMTDAGSVADAGHSPGPPLDAMPPPSPVEDSGVGTECALDGRCEITDECADPDCVPCAAALACPAQWPLCDEGYCVECTEDEDCGDWECDDGFCEPD